jgi:hypothetical protein
MRNDHEIREALVAGLETSGIRVVHEWAVWGSVIDVAAITAGQLHGYEIKGENDSLTRLEGQADSYGRVFDRMTLVTTERHVGRARAIVPDWWSIAIAQEPRSPGGRIMFVKTHLGGDNPTPDPKALAALLYARECRALCQRMCIPIRANGARFEYGKGKLTEQLGERVPMAELRAHVCRFLLARPYWKADGRRTLGKDTKRPGVPTG